MKLRVGSLLRRLQFGVLSPEEIETQLAQIEHEIDATAALAHDVQARRHVPVAKTTPERNRVSRIPIIAKPGGTTTPHMPHNHEPHRRCAARAVRAYTWRTEPLQCPAKELSVSTRGIVMAISLAGLTLVGPSINEAAAPIVDGGTTQGVPLAPSPVPPTRLLTTLPTVTPLRETLVRFEDAPRQLHGSRPAHPRSSTNYFLAADRHPVACPGADASGV